MRHKRLSDEYLKSHNAEFSPRLRNRVYVESRQDQVGEWSAQAGLLPRAFREVLASLSAFGEAIGKFMVGFGALWRQARGRAAVDVVENLAGVFKPAAVRTVSRKHRERSRGPGERATPRDITCRVCLLARSAVGVRILAIWPRAGETRRDSAIVGAATSGRSLTPFAERRG